MTATGWQGAERPGGGEPQFDIALRGYERHQVDDRLAQLAQQLAAAGHAVREAEHRSAELTGQLYTALSKLREAGNTQPDSFGFRVEKILRLAEEEAKELRAQGNAAATALVEQARDGIDAERAELDRQRAEVRAEAERLLAQARAHATALTAKVESDLARRRAAVEDELHRLTELRDQVYTELTGVRELLKSVVPEWPDQDRSGELALPRPSPASWPVGGGVG